MKRLILKCVKDQSDRFAFQIYNKRDYLGVIYYYYVWKRYVVCFDPNVILDYECLVEINAKLRALQ